MLSIKVHRSPLTEKTVLAVCDASLLGKRLEQGKRQLHVKRNFFDGNSVKEDEAIALLADFAFKENATINFVGKKAIAIGIKAGLVDKAKIEKIQKVPYAISL